MSRHLAWIPALLAMVLALLALHRLDRIEEALAEQSGRDDAAPAHRDAPPRSLDPPAAPPADPDPRELAPHPTTELEAPPPVEPERPADPDPEPAEGADVPAGYPELRAIGVQDAPARELARRIADWESRADRIETLDPAERARALEALRAEVRDRCRRTLPEDRLRSFARQFPHLWGEEPEPAGGVSDPHG